MRIRPSPALARRHLDLGADYMLRCVGLLAELFEGEIARGLVYLAALQASSQHLRNTPDIAPGAVIEDAMRRPVSLSGIARSLSMSVETTRRHVIRLEHDGLVARSPGGGVIVRFAELECDKLEAAVFINSGNLLRLCETLARPITEPDAPPNALRA